MLEIILQYEKDFFRKDFCNNIANLEMRLSKDFIEYSRSGKIYSRDTVIQGLSKLKEDRNIEITLLSANIALVTYISCSNNKKTLRTSIWENNHDDWKIRFYQGTPCAAHKYNSDSASCRLLS